jgi:hypothetical protein
MNFGKWIVVAFISFALYIGVLVVVCVKQDINLVSKDYYRDELKYQQKLDQINNTNHLSHVPAIDIENGQAKISFEENQHIQSGQLKIERPSNERLDRNFSLVPDQTTQEFNLGSWMPGLYRASVSWTMEGKKYYFEKQIIL